jgi:hypothetical protein
MRMLSDQGQYVYQLWRHNDRQIFDIEAGRILHYYRKARAAKPGDRVLAGIEWALIYGLRQIVEKADGVSDVQLQLDIRNAARRHRFALNRQAQKEVMDNIRTIAERSHIIAKPRQRKRFYASQQAATS